MNWARLVVIVVGAGVVSSLTDWFFAGDWIHRRYTYPEIWRQGAEGRAIALNSRELKDETPDLRRRCRG